MSTSEENSQKCGMIMRGPATRWQDASPTGNGAIGAMIYGQIRSDVVLLNHEALYLPRGRGELMDVSDQLPELRRLIDQKQYAEAKALLPKVHAESGGVGDGSTSDVTDPYQPFCDIRLRTSTQSPFSHYRRGVDFDTGRAWVEWSDDAGRTVRELFVSRASDTVFLRIRGDKPGVVHHRLQLLQHRDESGRDGSWAARKDLEPATYESSAEDEGWLTFTGHFPDSYSFGAVGRLTATGGRIHADQGELIVENADELLLQVKLFVRQDPEDALPRLRRELQDQTADFDAALAAHAELHSALFERMTLELSTDAPTSNEELLMTAYDGDVPTQLVQSMFAVGRYLLICSNRPGGWPANLQGIWNGDTAPAWNSDFHNDENVQMNYWPALPGNLPESTLPFFDYYERYLDDFRENARKLYGCRGIFVPIAQTTHGIAFPNVWANWTAAAGWLAQLFYDYYLFTNDEKFLAERAVPWLTEVAEFYEDFLFEGSDGKLLFSPSLSPENVPSGEGKDILTINATMDVAICREVLENLYTACTTLGIEADRATHWRTMLTSLPEYETNADGAFREWLYPSLEDNYHHRHQSHLYPLFPGFEITEETHPELYEACRIAVEKRLVIGLTSQSGWSMAHMANVYARLGQGNRALECIEILTRSSTGPNLFTYHNDWRDMGLSLTGWGAVPPFQIDANFGVTAAVHEMLAFSKPGIVKLLPARPDKWTCGRASGIACRGGILLDLEWDLSERTFSATLTSARDQKILLKLPAESSAVEFAPEGPAVSESPLGASYFEIDLSHAEPVQIRAEIGRGK